MRTIKRLLLASVLSLATSVAFADAVAPELHGIWASPNCQKPVETLAIFNGSYLWMGEDSTILAGVTASQTPDNGWHRLLESDGYITFFQLTPEKKLREAYRPDDAAESATPSENWETNDFQNCEGQLPASNTFLHGEPLAILRVVDSVYDRCSKDRGGCAATLFAGIDVSGNGKLSTAELARLLRVGTYLAAITSDETIKNDELAAAIAASIPLAPVIASALVHSFDYDADGSLSMIEISQDRGSLIDTLEPDAGDRLGKQLSDVKRAIKPLGKLLEGVNR